ncbi:MAG: ribosome small subunit-dependent GTPase A [Chitinivibrionales bacterium]|nr:ribosome small subunit-dependent GTPase A [Chitinivibrionales bacterium]
MSNEYSEEMGWSERFEAAFEQFRAKGWVPGRIGRQDRDVYQVCTETGEVRARVSGRFRHDAELTNGFPVVGDWVALQIVSEDDQAVIHGVCPRSRALCRKAPISGGRREIEENGQSLVLGGVTQEQVIVANVDLVFLMIGLDIPLNQGLISRCIIMCRECGAEIVVLLNKADLCSDTALACDDARRLVGDVPLHPICALDQTTMQVLDRYCSRGKTMVVTGPSGVGKTTLIRNLTDMATLKSAAVRESDGKGRHTTTWREMVVMPGKGVLIDNPGIRELQLWAGLEEVEAAFPDVEQLISQCRFSDCNHDTEPDCAIRTAIEEGSLDPRRFSQYLKIQREIAYLDRRKQSREKQLIRAKKRKNVLRFVEE